ncbi:MAG: ribosome assembly RNA-binding protein YhbY [Clostridiales bacterium]|nr:ribosome assembly RNA-binding protein YhbY [Clostridiales bacterium]
MLTAQQRAKLRSIGSNLKDLVFVGKEGVTENVIAQVDDNLYAHELIKVKVQKTAPDDIREIANMIAEKCLCEVVSVIGSKILLFKLTNKPKAIHLLDDYK